MFKLLNKLKLVYQYGPELDRMLELQRREKEEKEKELHRFNLNLCFKHRQERNHSHYGTSNCDYCKLLEENNKLKRHEI